MELKTEMTPETEGLQELRFCEHCFNWHTDYDYCRLKKFPYSLPYPKTEMTQIKKANRSNYKMKKEILQKTRESKVKNFVDNNKFLSNTKHYKYIKVSLAAHDSWAAQGQAGNCQICGVGHYNSSFQHKRFTTKKGDKPKEYHWNEWGKICSTCFDEIEKQCDYKFEKF